MKNTHAIVLLAGLSGIFAGSAQAAMIACGPASDSVTKKYLGYIEKNFDESVWGSNDHFKVHAYVNKTDETEIATVTEAPGTNEVCIAMRSNPFPR